VRRLAIVESKFKAGKPMDRKMLQESMTLIASGNVQRTWLLVSSSKAAFTAIVGSLVADLINPIKSVHKASTSSSTGTVTIKKRSEAADSCWRSVDTGGCSYRV
jgi:large-conductance mechanosensitive channel